MIDALQTQVDGLQRLFLSRYTLCQIRRYGDVEEIGSEIVNDLHEGLFPLFGQLVGDAFLDKKVHTLFKEQGIMESNIGLGDQCQQHAFLFLTVRDFGRSRPHHEETLMAIARQEREAQGFIWEFIRERAMAGEELTTELEG